MRETKGPGDKKKIPIYYLRTYFSCVIYTDNTFSKCKQSKKQQRNPEEYFIVN